MLRSLRPLLPSRRGARRASTALGAVAALVSLVLTGCTADTDVAHRASPAARAEAVGAEKTLYGDPAAWFRSDTTVSNLRPLYVSKLLHDKEFTSAVNAWSHCMSKAGHPFPDPDAARQSTREHSAEQTRAEEARTFAHETRIAVADATCARLASLRSIGERREAHYVGELAGKYGPALDARRRMQRHALTRAERIVPART